MVVLWDYRDDQMAEEKENRRWTALIERSRNICVVNLNDGIQLEMQLQWMWYSSSLYGETDTASQILRPIEAAQEHPNLFRPSLMMPVSWICVQVLEHPHQGSRVPCILQQHQQLHSSAIDCCQ